MLVEALGIVPLEPDGDNICSRSDSLFIAELLETVLTIILFLLDCGTITPGR